MSKLSLREIAQSQLDSTPVIDGQLIVCLDTGNAYRDNKTAHVKIGSDLEVVSELPLAPLANKIYYLKPDKLYVFNGGDWQLLNEKTIDLDAHIAALPAGSETTLNDDMEIITQDIDTKQAHYYRRKLGVLWTYIKTKAQDFFAAKDHKHKKADITDFPTSMPASDVYPWAKAATKPSYTKAEVGLDKVDNTADADKTVKRATTAGTADSANSVAWTNVKDKPTSFPAADHNHDSRYYTESEMDGKLALKAVCVELAKDTDLNTIITPGFYNCGGSNSLVNKPAGLDAIGLIVIHQAGGSHYTQILTTTTNANTYRRRCYEGKWSEWTIDKYTDTNTWRGIQDNLTSDSTTDSLSAAQGKVLKGLVDGKAASNHKHVMTDTTDWGDYIYSAKTSRTANTVLAAPNGSDGSASFRRLTTADVPDASVLINNLSVGTSDPVDADYYVSQAAGGGTTTTTYHRRPMSALWNYIKGKADGVYLKLTGGTVNGPIHLKPSGNGSYNENIRIHPSPSNWTSITMCGDDNTGDSGTSAKTWGIFTHNGLFGISKNGNADSTPGTASLVCDTSNTWKANNVELLTVAGGTMTGQIKRSSGGSWHNGRDNAALFGTSYGQQAGMSYNVVVGQKTSKGAWTMGNLSGEEDLTFSYTTDANYTAGKNDNAQVKLPAQAGTIITSATIGSQSVSKANNLNYFKCTSTTNVGVDDVTANAIGYVNGISLLGQGDGALYKQVYSDKWAHEIYGDYRTGQIALRGKNNGTWQGWRTVLDSSNYSGYALPKSGGTMSGSLTFANNTWNLVGDDAYIGDHNIGGAVCFVGANGGTKIVLCNKSNQADYAYIGYEGGNILVNKTIGGNISGSSGSCTGNAATATKATSANKLTTARTVSGGTDIRLSFNYDGSANSSASLGYYSCNGSVGNTNNYPWHRFASYGPFSGAWNDAATLFYVTQDYSGGGFGIFRICLRTNANSGSMGCEVRWLVRSGISADQVQIHYYPNQSSAYADAFFKTQGTYAGFTMRAIASGYRAGIGATWKLISSNEVNGTTTSNKGSSSECWASIASAGSALHGKAYTASASGYDSGGVSSANTVNGHSVNKDVPSNAVFTDTNTWRGIQNNLTSTSTTDSLSAAQGKALNEKIAAAGVSASGSNYVRFGNGTQICWGVTNVSATSGTVTFSAAFNNSSYGVALNAYNKTVDYGITIKSQSTSSFSWGKNGAAPNGITWVAAGTWK